MSPRYLPSPERQARGRMTAYELGRCSPASEQDTETLSLVAPVPHLKPRLVIGSHVPTRSRSSSYDESILRLLLNDGLLADCWILREPCLPCYQVLDTDGTYGFGRDESSSTHYVRVFLISTRAVRSTLSRDSQRLDKFARARAIPCLESRFCRNVRETTLMQKRISQESTIVPRHHFNPFIIQAAVVSPTCRVADCAPRLQRSRLGIQTATNR
jgi:hypothetical protein